MCGIVGAVAQRDISEILLQGLQRLEYRGYDSAGLAISKVAGSVERVRSVGKVQSLVDKCQNFDVSGGTGIAHTRWATHGGVTEANAHPHMSGDDLVIVHNGIIENHQELRTELKAKGYVFTSDTDTEVLAHLIAENKKSASSLFDAVRMTTKMVRGAYGTVIMDVNDPERLIVARSGSPLVIGLGIGENFIASDLRALLPVTNNFMYLEEGDVAEVTRFDINIQDSEGNAVTREAKVTDISVENDGKGEYRHYMLKEIFEQPHAVRNALAGRLVNGQVQDDVFGVGSAEIFEKVQHIQIIACGTSYHSAMVARYWLEDMVGISCNVEIASEFRYRRSFVHANSLLVTISQSGETADTLAALRLAQELGYMSSLVLCNVDGSSLVRESDLAFMTKAGTEIGVASTKAFTTQLVGLLMMVLAIGQKRGMSNEQQQAIVSALNSLPAKIEEALALSDSIESLACEFADKNHALFLGRGDQYPIAMEGALKLKEISYIHAEAYAAGELKHGPLALIDADIPIIVVAPNNELLEKLHSNVEEVRARGGQLYVFADAESKFISDDTMRVIDVPIVDEIVAPILYTIPLQLLSYYVAIIKGTDVDQPRNLAKSVTVE
ncbi:MAG: glutamine--fructose-6-phosphate transaminase (isomerizing) [Psychrobium sp.]|nr:glutamine--fructose-6-phosphate transaminase (isomerizing) [Psychrobium sp.]